MGNGDKPSKVQAIRQQAIDPPNDRDVVDANGNVHRWRVSALDFEAFAEDGVRVTFEVSATFEPVDD